MPDILTQLETLLSKNGVVMVLVFVGLLVWLSYVVSDRLTRGRLHGSAIAIFLGLLLACMSGWTTGGEKGVADLPALAGVAVLGGAMLRDLAICGHGVWRAGGRTAERRADRRRFAGPLGLVVSFVVGGATAFACGYRDAASIVTLVLRGDLYCWPSSNRNRRRRQFRAIVLSVAVSWTGESDSRDDAHAVSRPLDRSHESPAP